MAALENLVEVIQARDYMLLLAFFNSTSSPSASVTLLVIFAAMVGYVLQRRRAAGTPVNFLVLAGLMIPPAVVPTIWVLQGIGLFKTLHGMVLIQVAYGLSFSILLYRAFIAHHSARPRRGRDHRRRRARCRCSSG